MFGWKYDWCICWRHFKGFKQNSVDWSFSENAGSGEFHYRLFDGKNERPDNSFKRLESDVQIVITVNNNLLKQLKNTERQCWANGQYSRRECVEVIGIPKTVESKDLEHTVCKVFNSIGFDIGEDRIEACHRLTKSYRTIVKFSRHLSVLKRDWKISSQQT